MEEGARKNVRAEDGEECYEVLSSGPNSAVAFMNSQQLWLLAEDQARQRSSMDGRDAHESLPLAQELLALAAVRIREAIFHWLR